MAYIGRQYMDAYNLFSDLKWELWSFLFFLFFLNLHQCDLIGILDIKSSCYFLLTLCDQPVL